jgi:hypothetical protein
MIWDVRRHHIKVKFGFNEVVNTAYGKEER